MHEYARKTRIDIPRHFSHTNHKSHKRSKVLAYKREHFNLCIIITREVFGHNIADNIQTYKIFPTDICRDMNIVWQVSVLLKTNKTTLESVKAFMKEPHPQLS